MSQAGDYIINKSLGKEPNPKGVKILEIPKIDGKNAWKFPDGSKMIYLGDSKYMEIEEL